MYFGKEYIFLGSVICVVNLICYSFYINFCETLINYMLRFFLFRKFNKKRLYAQKMFLIGLGFKMYMYKSYIYILLGYSHYMLLKIPKGVFCFFFKKRGLIVSFSKIALINICTLIKTYRKLNFISIKVY